MSFFGGRRVCSSCAGGLASATGAKREARMASADLPAAGGSSGAVRGTGGAFSGSTASRSGFRDIVVGKFRRPPIERQANSGLLGEGVAVHGPAIAGFRPH